MDRRNMRWAGWQGWVCAGLLALGLAAPALAGTSGKLVGRVVDAKKQPLASANVIVVGHPLGAATDVDGRFVILNIPAGRISVKASLIGYRATVVENVDISADNTTAIDDIELAESAVQMQEVVVSARRPVVEVHRTSNIASVTKEQIATLPVQELQDVVNLQAGVVDGHFRGGRAGEVQYQVDGVSVNNAFDNSSTLKLDRSLLEEVQVISGTFDAEYGQAMSGVVNAVLKRGTEKFHWDAETFGGGYVFGNDRIVSNDIHPAALQNYQLNISGPAKLPKTFYLLSARHAVTNSYLTATRRFSATIQQDPNAFASANIVPTGDGKDEPLGYTHEWSGVAKVTNRSIPNVELDYQLLLNLIDARADKWAYRLDPDGATKQHTVSLVQGMDLTHTLSKTQFYTLSVRQNYTDYRDLAYTNIFDPRYDAGGPPLGNSNYELGANVEGVDFGRFKQKTNGAVFKGSFVDQQTRDHQLKIGGEFQAPHVSFGQDGHLVDSLVGNTRVLVRKLQDTVDYPGIREYRPFIGAAFAQEEVEWNDLTFRGGLRLEYFNARSTLPSDLANPANAIAGAPESHARSTTPKYSLAPRVGVSYPINQNSALFFAYGHFYQFPGLGDIFTNADYSVLKNLQASTNSYGVLGNPDIKPERTVQYQFGYKHAISEYLGLDVSMFYKDIRDLLGVEFISTYNDASYARLTNVDFGNVIGMTVTLDQRARGLFSSTIDYTWQVAQGNSSDPTETATRAAAGEDPRPRSVPFNWDQRHTLNMTLMWSRPKKWSASTILRAASGQPYTPAITTGFSSGLTQNSGNKPGAFQADFRAERSIELHRATGAVFARVFNVFDTRYFNGFVFNDTDSPYYTAFGANTEQAVLNDPTRFFAPRRIEVGVTFSARD